MPMAVLPWTGSSPHTRGAQPGRPSPAPIPRIIPAYAGSTDVFPLAGDIVPDHPRIRGEHADRVQRALEAGGSSPHTRGARRSRGLRRHRRRIIPAYAGSTTSSPPPAVGPGDHPRIRGEHAQMPMAILPWTGSSPHTRGARRAFAGPGRRRGIIPAYAGSTPAGLFWRRRDRDHPRIRGEHLPDADGCAALDGSSPHTRGALQLGADQSRHLGIIPAYAGSTSCGRR